MRAEAAKRSGRRAEATELDRKTLVIRIVSAAVVFAAVTAAATMWSVSLFNDAKDARIAVEDSEDIIVDSIYDDRIESRFDADYDRTRYREIAAGFDSDPIYVDDYLAWAVTDAELDEIRTAVDGLEAPIYVAFLASSDLDATDGDPDLAAARITRELPTETGTVLVLGDIAGGTADKGIKREWVSRPGTDIDDTVSYEALEWVRAIAAEEVGEPHGETEYIADLSGEKGAHDLAYHPGTAVSGAVFGLLVGGGAGALLIVIMRWVRRRRQSGITRAATTAAGTTRTTGSPTVPDSERSTPRSEE